MPKHFFVSKNIALYLVVLIALAMLSSILAHNGFLDKAILGVGIVWSFLLMFGLLSLIDRNTANINLISVVFAAFLIRMIVLIIEISTDNAFGNLLHVLDSDMFENMALDYYYGYTNTYQTKYPGIINTLFLVFGPNIYLVRLLNVILATLTIIYACRILSVLNISIKGKQIASIIIGLTPYSIYYSASLMREAMYLFFLSASFYLFIKWKKEHVDLNIYFAIALTIPALYLHSGYLSFPAVYLFYYVFDKTKAREGKMSVIILRIIGCLVILVFLSQLQSMFYIFRSKDAGILDSIRRTYRQHSNQGGGSQYLSWMTTSNPFEIILYTPIRMVYFLISPFLLDWRGFGDIASFFLDGLIHMVIIWSSVHKLAKRKSAEKSENMDVLKWGLMIIFLTAIIFCWGTTTSGAAIRHRNCLFGVESIMCAVLFDNRQKEKYIS